MIYPTGVAYGWGRNSTLAPEQPFERSAEKVGSEPKLTFAVSSGLLQAQCSGEGRVRLISIFQGKWELSVEDGGLPASYTSYTENANFVDEIQIHDAEGRLLFLGGSKRGTNRGWPSLVVSQKYEDARRTWTPGFLVAPDTSLVFIGAGERLLCYDVERHEKLWEDVTDCGFWHWAQYGSYVLMSAELEFAVWDDRGKKLWNTFVEPPWTFEVKGAVVELEVMGDRRLHRLVDGKHVT